MIRSLKLYALLTSIYAINSTAERIETFDELKVSYLSGATVTAVVDFGLCKSDSDKYLFGNFRIGQYKNLHVSFSSTNGFHSIEESTAIESFTFLNSGKYLQYNPVNQTNSFSPAGLISELLIRQNGEVYLVFGINNNENPEQKYIFSCEWGSLVLNSIQ